MRHFTRAAMLGAALLSVGACGEKSTEAAAKQGAPASARDWRATVVATPEGGVRMGNPDARVKLIEYASFTCTHCRDFHLAAAPVLKDQLVRAGRVSYEYRPFMLNGVDVVAALAAKCTGPQRFFVMADQLYRTHDTWVLPFTRLTPAQLGGLQRLPQDQQLPAYAAAGRFGDWAKLRGLPAAKLNQCLADQGAFNRLQAAAQQGQDQFQITGTPTFIINGVKQENVASWDLLKPKLDALLS